MLLLALDTAGPDCAVALASNGRRAPTILASTAERIGRGHSERLMPMIEETLAEAGVRFADLHRIAVTTGPGSFTGVRVGIATARALALSLGLTAIGVGSLSALLADVLEENAKGTAVAVLDARHGKVYARVQDMASGVVAVEAEAVGIEELAAMLRRAAPPVLLSGAGTSLLENLLDKQARVVGTRAAPDIAAVARLGLGARAMSPVPIYARGADAKPQLDKAVLRA